MEHELVSKSCLERLEATSSRPNESQAQPLQSQLALIEQENEHKAKQLQLRYHPTRKPCCPTLSPQSEGFGGVNWIQKEWE